MSVNHYEIMLIYEQSRKREEKLRQELADELIQYPNWLSDDWSTWLIFYEGSTYRASDNEQKLTISGNIEL